MRSMINDENKKTRENEASNVIEDLTLGETETASVKGGASDYLLMIDGIKGESSSAISAGYDLKLNKKI